MDLQLLAALGLGIAAIVVIVLRTRLDAFLALLIAALITGFVAGLPAAAVLDSITTGFGNTMRDIGIVIGLGVAIGKILEVSGAADRLARAFVRAFGKGREPWAMAGSGAAVSVPVFCDSGYVMMNPLARSLARRKGTGYVTLALALGCGMTISHHLVPPTPGPLAVAGVLGADLGALLASGFVFILVLLPVVVFYAKWIGPKLEADVLPEVREQVYGAATASPGAASPGVGRTDAPANEPTDATPSPVTDTASPVTDNPSAEAAQPPPEDPASALGPPPKGAKPHRVSTLMAFIPLLIPLLLIIANTAATAIDQNLQNALGDEEYEPARWAEVLAFVGNPAVALLVGIVLAVYVLLPRWTTRRQVSGWLSEAASSAGMILLITGAGGAFGLVLRESGVGDELARAISAWSIPAVLVPFLIATLVRIAQGSGTVAMITAASVTAPMLDGIGISPLLAALACCAGSMVFSYFNDSYFWVVTRFTGLDGVAAIRGWSGITTAVWLASLPPLLLASVIL